MADTSTQQKGPDDDNGAGVSASNAFKPAASSGTAPSNQDESHTYRQSWNGTPTVDSDSLYGVHIGVKEPSPLWVLTQTLARNSGTRTAVLYQLIRVLVYVGSSAAYVVAQSYDQENADTRIDYDYTRPWVMLTNDDIFVVQFVLSCLTMIDTAMRLLLFRPQAVLTFDLSYLFYDMVNVLVFVLLCMRIPGTDSVVLNGAIVVPSFLHIWTAREASLSCIRARIEMLQAHHERVDVERLWYIHALTSLITVILAILFTAACGVEHLEKRNDEEGSGFSSLFVALWFVIVTFSTVGYGDFSPISVEGRIFVIGMIVVALVVLPDKFDRISKIQSETNRRGRRKKDNRTKKHVVVCGGMVHTSDVEGLLEELIVNMPQPPSVVILSVSEESHDMKRVLSRPMYAGLASYLMGSTMSQEDLFRARAHDADAIFVLAERDNIDSQEADRRTLLRARSVFDITEGQNKLFVQVVRPENVKHFEVLGDNCHTVCVDELRFSLLASNSICNGLISLITSLCHARDVPDRHRVDPDDVFQCYENALGNEILSEVVGKSHLFRRYMRQNFYHVASVLIDQGICLIGVRLPRSRDGSNQGRIVLRPDKRLVLRPQMTVFYLSTRPLDELTIDFDDAPLRGAALETYVGDEMSSSAKRPSRQRLATVSFDDDSRKHSTNVHALSAKQKWRWAYARVKEQLRQKRQSRASPTRTSSRASLDSSSGNEGAEFVPRRSDKGTIETVDVAEVTTDDFVVTKFYVCRDVMYFGSPSFTCHCIASSDDKTVPLARPKDALYLREEQVKASTHFVIVVLPELQDIPSGLYLFIRCMRQGSIFSPALKPVLLVAPFDLMAVSQHFIKFIALFSDIYIMYDDIEKPSPLLRQAIRSAESVLILGAEQGIDAGPEAALIDGKNMVATLNAHTILPSVNLLTELRHRHTASLMQYQRLTRTNEDDDESDEADTGHVDAVARHMLSIQHEFELRGGRRRLFTSSVHAPGVSQVAKLARLWNIRFSANLRSAASGFVYRHSFASGKVFSPSMLDNLLFQTYLPNKSGFLQVVRLLCGCEDAQSVVFSLKVTRVFLKNIREDKSHRHGCDGQPRAIGQVTYGDVCRVLYRDERQIPIGIRVSRRRLPTMHWNKEMGRVSNADMSQWQSLDIVLPNPVPKMQVHEGDRLYVLQAPQRGTVGARSALGSVFTPTRQLALFSEALEEEDISDAARRWRRATAKIIAQIKRDRRRVSLELARSQMSQQEGEGDDQNGRDIDPLLPSSGSPGSEGSHRAVSSSEANVEAQAGARKNEVSSLRLQEGNGGRELDALGSGEPLMDASVAGSDSIVSISESTI